jgi:geranylgeranyl pyrophosphate synthase
MASKKKTIEQVKALLSARGQKALELAKLAMLQERIEYEPLKEALRYFIEEVWFDFLHPALLSLACEAVGGDSDRTTQVGAAMVLLAGAADIHDDIIDRSKIKGSKKTVLGKFGEDIAILAGDALILKGLYILHEVCNQLPDDQKRTILDLTKQAFFGISSAEAKEASLRGKLDLLAEDYLDIVRKKAAVAGATAKIGAILGDANPEEIEYLGQYGKTLGIILTTRDEFIDVFEAGELKNRAENECLPLPILFAFQDKNKKDRILRLLRGNITEKEVETIADLVMTAKETMELKSRMLSLVEEQIQQINCLRKNRNSLTSILKSLLHDLG